MHDNAMQSSVRVDSLIVVVANTLPSVFERLNVNVCIKLFKMKTSTSMILGNLHSHYHFALSFYVLYYDICTCHHVVHYQTH